MRRITIRWRPAVAKIIFVKDRQAGTFVIRKNEVLQPDLGGLECPMIGEAVLVEFRRSDDQAADVELVEVAVRPAERRLKHFMELGEIQFDRELKGAADLGLDVEDRTSAEMTKASGSKGLAMADDYAVVGGAVGAMAGAGSAEGGYGWMDKIRQRTKPHPEALIRREGAHDYQRGA